MSVEAARELCALLESAAIPIGHLAGLSDRIASAVDLARDADIEALEALGAIMALRAGGGAAVCCGGRCDPGVGCPMANDAPAPAAGLAGGGLLGRAVPFLSRLLFFLAPAHAACGGVDSGGTLADDRGLDVACWCGSRVLLARGEVLDVLAGLEAARASEGRSKRVALVGWAINCPWCAAPVVNPWTTAAYVVRAGQMFGAGGKITGPSTLPDGTYARCPACAESFALEPRPSSTPALSSVSATAADTRGAQ